ncbi:MAG: hypothetical protein HUJ54_13760, partial [Erysipelotrichaceae bacterium]|nr:hypothetical protein [Erysipelotrichaceae bacterium]
IKVLFDPEGKFDYQLHPITVICSCTLENGNLLYGPNGIAPSNNRVGVALQWYSKESGVRGAVCLTEVPHTSQKINKRKGINFDPGFFREKLEILPLLYIMDSVVPPANQAFLAHQSGITVGALKNSQLSIQFSGTGSIFPYTEAELTSSDPLWQIQCDWTDPVNEMFDEHVQIIVNTKHKNYPEVNPDSPSYHEALFLEMISHAFFVLFAKLRMNTADWEIISNGSDFAEGTIAQALNYYYTTFGREWNWDSLESIDNGLKKYLNRSFNSK